MTTQPPPGAALPSVRRTPALSGCVEVARALADGEGDPVGVLHLLLAAMCSGDPSSRSRLVMKSLAAHHFLTEEATGAVAAAEAGVNGRTRAVPLSPAAAAALGRLGYWTRRTGDGSADTAHLLLACLEARAEQEDVRRFLRGTGLSERVVVRSAMTERHRVCVQDRQPSDRGPILSPGRPDRPAAYSFETRARQQAKRTVRSIGMRSENSGVAHVSSRVQSHLVRLHIWVRLWAQLVVLCTLAATAWASLTVTAWSALWLASQLARRQNLSPAARLAVDLALLIASAVLGIPWWLALLALVNRVFDLLDGRLLLLQVKSDTGDPALTEKDIRADRREDRRAAGLYRVLKLTGKLAPE
ncbi:hypothetical protein ACGFYQ_11300 [Streptomyces sp. NPDC048258]|uniref:hypothetical protein n=1 Tax=Streptomyces sp. NPDC048258 TaxID=3365527 RepID=UPI003717AEEF